MGVNTRVKVHARVALLGVYRVGRDVRVCVYVWKGVAQVVART